MMVKHPKFKTQASDKAELDNKNKFSEIPLEDQLEQPVPEKRSAFFEDSNLHKFNMMGPLISFSVKLKFLQQIRNSFDIRH